MPQSHLTILKRQLTFTPDAFALWARMPYWSVEEALVLVSNCSAQTDEMRSPLIREVVLRAKEVGWLSDPVKPPAFVKWMRSQGFPVPEELMRLVLAAQEGFSEGCYEDSAGDSKLARATEAFQYYKAKASRLGAENARLERELLSLKEELADGVGRSNAKVRNTLLRLVGGMAMAIYNYDPEAGRSEVVSQIQNDLDLKGIILDADTIRKHVREGARLAKAAADGVSKPK